MAKYGPADFKIEYDNSGDSLVDITAHVLTINDIDVETIVEGTHPFGVAWEESLPIGVGRMAPVELSGLFDDVGATGPDALFKRATPDGPAAATRGLKVTYGGTKTTSVETHVASYKRTADRAGLTKYTVRLQPTGTVTEV